MQNASLHPVTAALQSASSIADRSLSAARDRVVELLEHRGPTGDMFGYELVGLPAVEDRHQRAVPLVWSEQHGHDAFEIARVRAAPGEAESLRTVERYELACDLDLLVRK